ncbi:UNVERIFIED_CONTAM: hypothetical protein GTU68_013767 [Idotea baltica]|nr:hypothetical protein [Idotea baltica]
MGCAQTGTGKTAAFAIPIIQHIYNNKQHNNSSKKIKALIVTPTRELAIQIFDNFKIYGKNTNIRCNVIFGGVKQGKQTAALKQGVDVLVATPGRLLDLMSQGFISLTAIHGNKSQGARVKALEGFKDGNIKVLVATDIAARGIDIDELALVVNYDLPNIAETYVHRIGRTGRAKASGVAVSFCDQEERAYLRDIEKLIKQKVPVISEHPFIDFKDDNLQSDDKPKQHNRSRNSSNRNSNNRNKNNANRNKRRNQSNSNSRQRD